MQQILEHEGRGPCPEQCHTPLTVIRDCHVSMMMSKKMTRVCLNYRESNKKNGGNMLGKEKEKENLLPLFVAGAGVWCVWIRWLCAHLNHTLGTLQ